MDLDGRALVDSSAEVMLRYGQHFERIDGSDSVVSLRFGLAEAMCYGSMCDSP